MDVLSSAAEVLIATVVLIVVHFPLEATRSLLSFGSVPAARYSHRQQARAIASEVARTRERLGRFIDEGRLLLARLRDPAKDAEASRSHAQAWAAQVEEFLSNDLGGAYVDRFHVRSNVSDGEIIGIPPERLPDWRNLRDCLFNLEMFSAEI
ncbi:hypothetical protein AYJ54_21325 [Bradyrhizobium centrolobii]|uniref:Uncharacterized protein n=1 Tax=Bradyrhizobium centrolobii TaxID=1505087 RepID=A0A176YIR5_9BRAD|nr:hypothetical protein [Bradyrhizobium centrolobii]OAF06208.1 hypothetical protein AYJ54_21325 [Bradyrhizobium centrolobii]